MIGDKKIRILSFISLFISIVGLTIAFMTITTMVKINKLPMGSNDNKYWDIHFENLKNGKTTGDAKIEKSPKISLNTTNITGFSFRLVKPKDSVSYEFDVKNNGDLDAKISSFTKQNSICNGIDEFCNNINYELIYKDSGKPVKVADELKAGDITTMILKVSYNEDATELPSKATIIDNLNIVILYEQS